MPTNRINRLRKESGMNQRELGTMLGVGQTTISAWETGKNEPDNESMHKMAKFFQVSIGYLMGYESSRVAGLTQTELKKYQQENEKAFLRHQEKQEEAFLRRQAEQPELDSIMEETNFYEWQNTDQTTYFEFFQLNKLGNYLTKEQRQRILDVAKVMFPNAEKGLYTDETTHE